MKCKPLARVNRSAEHNTHAHYSWMLKPCQIKEGPCLANLYFSPAFRRRNAFWTSNWREMRLSMQFGRWSSRSQLDHISQLDLNLPALLQGGHQAWNYMDTHKRLCTENHATSNLPCLADTVLFLHLAHCTPCEHVVLRRACGQNGSYCNSGHLNLKHTQYFSKGDGGYANTLLHYSVLEKLWHEKRGDGSLPALMMVLSNNERPDLYTFPDQSCCRVEPPSRD